MKKLYFAKKLNSKSIVYAGKYADRKCDLRNTIYIKLAEEFDLPCDIDCPIADFSVPKNDKILNDAIIAALKQIENGGNIFVGCRGGMAVQACFLLFCVNL